MVIIAHLRHSVQTHHVYGLRGKIIAHYLVPIVLERGRGWGEGICYSKDMHYDIQGIIFAIQFCRNKIGILEFMEDQRTEVCGTT